MYLAAAFAQRPEKKYDKKEKLNYLFKLGGTVRNMSMEVHILYGICCLICTGKFRSSPICHFIVHYKIQSEDVNKQTAIRHTLIPPNVGWII